MTRDSFARLAGFMFLFYIANGITDLVLSGRAQRGANDAAVLANIARHADLMRFTTFLTFLTGVDAIVLGVALYAITREVSHDLAIMALAFRVGEGINGAMAGASKMHIIEFATRTAGRTDDVVSTVGTSLLHGGSITIGGTLFACGSTIFAFLILRGRILPDWLAWIGVAGSLLILIALPLQMAGVLRGPATNYAWIPIAIFEVVGGLWLLVKGARTPAGFLPASSGSRP